MFTWKRDAVLNPRRSVHGTSRRGGLLRRELTPNGFEVIALVFFTASRRASGEGWVSAVRMPRPPALLTAATNLGSPTCNRRQEVSSDSSGNASRSSAHPLHASLHNGALGREPVRGGILFEQREDKGSHRDSKSLSELGGDHSSIGICERVLDYVCSAMTGVGVGYKVQELWARMFDAFTGYRVNPA